VVASSKEGFEEVKAEYTSSDVKSVAIPAMLI
jgi:hypothetical protein